MWVFRFSTNEKILWGDEKFSSVTGHKSPSTLAEMPAGSLFYVLRPTRHAEDASGIRSTIRTSTTRFSSADIFSTKNIFPGVIRSFSGERLEVDCQEIIQVVTQTGAPIINWPGYFTPHGGASCPARFSIWASTIHPEPVFSCLCIPDHPSIGADTQIDAFSGISGRLDEDLLCHEANVARLSRAIGESLGLNRTKIEVLSRAAKIHDIGKIVIPDEIIHKPASLTPAEEIIVHRHPIFSAALLTPYSVFRQEIPIIAAHHEKWDGSGYPRGIAGSAIPLSARIISVADTYQALIEKRPYKPCWSPNEALGLLDEEAGKCYDREIVNRLKAVVRPGSGRRPSSIRAFQPATSIGRLV